jgi:hypothetical protein
MATLLRDHFRSSLQRTDDAEGLADRACTGAECGSLPPFSNALAHVYRGFIGVLAGMRLFAVHGKSRLLWDYSREEFG